MILLHRKEAPPIQRSGNQARRAGRDDIGKATDLDSRIRAVRSGNRSQPGLSSLGLCLALRHDGEAKGVQ